MTTLGVDTKPEAFAPLCGAKGNFSAGDGAPGWKAGALQSDGGAKRAVSRADLPGKQRLDLALDQFGDIHGSHAGMPNVVAKNELCQQPLVLGRPVGRRRGRHPGG